MNKVKTIEIMKGYGWSHLIKARRSDILLYDYLEDIKLYH